MNKKIFIIIGTIIIVLIFLILILFVILDNKNPTGNVDFSMTPTNDSNEVNDNQIDEPITTENPSDNREPINGEIEFVTTEDGGVIPVPPTFSYIEGGANTGAVIKDKDGNEFVWVPVNDFNSYHRQMFLNNGEQEKNNSSKETTELSEFKDINSYNEEYDDSVRNYYGFYVARYEAEKTTIKGKNYVISKPGFLPWTQVTWKKAKEVSTQMYVENNYFSTDLINSYAWDTICNWLSDTGTNIDYSVEYGNYKNSSNGLNKIVETASNERWKTNNIYDLAGNAWEYTTEETGKQDEIKHIGRGGGYNTSGDTYPVSSRATSEEDSPNIAISFRVVLYLK